MRIELLLFSIGFVSAGFLQEQSSEEIDPISQSGDNSEDNDQSKRTLFDDGERYALEKHVKYNPHGYKYLLGYRPVKLQLVPMARPLFTRPRMKPLMQLRPVHIGNKPVVSLVPPKLNPIYKPAGYIYKRPLPANVPPTVPTKPWQHQGWNMFKSEIDSRPFIPSSPLPDADNNAQDHNLYPPFTPPNPPTAALPVIPSTSVHSRPTFEVQPVQPPASLHPVVPVHTSVPIQHVVTIPAPLPAVNLQPALPLPPPVQQGIPLPLQPTVPAHFPVQPIPDHPTVQSLPTHPPAQLLPIHPPLQPFPIHPPVQPLPVHAHGQPNFNTVLHNIPVHFLPGNINIPVPDLGVLPLGSPVPVHLSAQSPQVFHKTSIYPLQPSGPIHFNPQQTQLFQKTPIFPVNSAAVHLASQEVHRTPVIESPAIQKFVPELHYQQMPKPQFYLGEPQILNKVPDSASIGSGFTPVENPPQHDIHISVNSRDQSMSSNSIHEPSQQHNYQYFVQQFSPNNAQHYQKSEEQSQGHVQQQQQQGYEESSGFFQPGQTDLQIPDYLPEHPHFKQYQDSS